MGKVRPEIPIGSKAGSVSYVPRGFSTVDEVLAR